MEKSKVGKKKKQRNLAPLVVLLAVGFFVVFALIRYLETDEGRVLLLDAGIGSTYSRVQGDIGGRIVGALERAGVEEDRITLATETGQRPSRPVVTVSAETDRDASLVKINSMISGEVEGIGARVHSCIEIEGGSGIVMEIGTRRVVTHRCIIKRKSGKKVSDESRDKQPEVALIVDDFGYFNNALVRNFLSLDIPLTISVIPGLKHSVAICKAGSEAGKDVLCHLPMEPQRGSEDYGEIPLVRVAMSSGDIRRVVEKALETTPQVKGMNNHMGSRATADRRVMEAVLEVCRRKDLFFIDSMTTPESVVRETAEKIGVRCLSNDIFIDNTEDATRENMLKLLSMAARKGSVIAILHVRQQTLDDLRWFIEEARRRGVRFIKVSEMIDRITLAMNEGGRQ
jgi:polysaccharide deacetylase 2 family uncharacterized protein YibQ